MIRYKLFISYLGNNYFGWQKQINKQKTIQNILEMNFYRVYGGNIFINGSSRTDSGVHAVENTADIDLPEKANIQKAINFINSKSKEEIFIKGAIPVEEDFDCRKQAKERTYIYRIINTKKNSRLSKYYWFLQDSLNIKNMKLAAKLLKGKHDFSSFRAFQKSNKNIKTIRNIKELKIQKIPFEKSKLDFPKLNITKEEVENLGNEIRITIRSKSFMYHQVRIMVGYLVKVGRGIYKPEMTSQILKLKDRKYTSFLAPSHGLYLYKVNDGIELEEEEEEE